MPPPEPYKTHSLAGQVVLITGASSGIGEACAWRFAEAGAKLVLIARRRDRLEQLAADISAAYKGGVHSVCLDVRDSAAVLRLPSELPSAFAEVDVLVNNAGLALGTEPVHEMSLDDVSTMLDTNVKQLMVFTRTFTPGMVLRNRGHVINIGSVAGHESYGGGGAYCACKHAVDAFTTAMRHDLVATDIRVTVISPGAVRTEFSLVRFAGDETKADAVYAGFHPLLADDIADNAVYAATRPPHVQVAELLVFATYQSSAKTLARVLPH